MPDPRREACSSTGGQNSRQETETGPAVVDDEVIVGQRMKRYFGFISKSMAARYDR